MDNVFVIFSLKLNIAPTVKSYSAFIVKIKPYKGYNNNNFNIHYQFYSWCQSNDMSYITG